MPAKYEYKHPWRRAAKKSVLWGEWVAVMIAALVAVVVGVLSGFFGVDDPTKQVYLGAAVFMILAIGDLVRVRYSLQIADQQAENVALHLRVEEFEAVTSSQAGVSQELPEPAPPSLSLALLGGNVFTPTDRPTSTGLALEARIHNSGGPSRAINWRLMVRPSGQVPKVAQLTNPPPKLRLGGQRSDVLSQGDFSLEKKAMGTLLSRGDPPIEGKLLFYVEMLQADVIAPNTELELSVEDVDGRQVSARQRMGDWLTSDQ